MFKRILVPLDGSETSLYALDQALEIAKREDALLKILCVIDTRLLYEARVYLPTSEGVRVSEDVVGAQNVESTYQAWADRLTSEALKRGESAGVQVQAEIVTSIPYQEITTRSKDYDLLVLGPWNISRDYAGPFLAGSTIWHLLAHTQLPIMCVQEAGLPLETILVVLDDTSETLDSLQLAATWAQAWGLKLVLLSVQPDEGQAWELLDKAQERIAPVKARLVARDGDATAVILATALDFKCDLIAMGVHPEHALLRHPLDDMIENLLENFTLPLLLSH
jgi:nucleotide-binding universal stress UspA family protein